LSVPDAVRELIGYASHLSAAPGETVSFMVGR
jgi:hypothetical protein